VPAEHRRGRLLARAFFDRPALDVAPGLLGAVLEHTTAAGAVALRLTEVEAYEGADDPGSHAYRGRTERNAVMFGPPGHAYVYFTYGMHWCLNLVCGPAGRASAVLLRAGEVVAGHDLAASRRTTARSARELARGPARLTVALGVTRAENGLDVVARGGALTVRRGDLVPADLVRAGPRVGLAGEAAGWPWRFWADGEPSVSAYRPAVSRRRAAAGSRRRPAPASGRL
jgi:DNA-3-methyladenine glycosylase